MGKRGRAKRQTDREREESMKGIQKNCKTVLTVILGNSLNSTSKTSNNKTDGYHNEI